MSPQERFSFIVPDIRRKGNTSLGKVKLALKSSWNRTNDTVNELANDAVCIPVSSIRSEPGAQFRASSVSTTPSKFAPLQSSLTLAEAVDMPAPPVPQILAHVKPDNHRGKGKKSPKLWRKGDAKRVRPVISAPVLQGTGPELRTRPIISASTAQESSLVQTEMPAQDLSPSQTGMPAQETSLSQTGMPAQEPCHSQTGMLRNDDAARPQGISNPQMSTADAEALNRKFEMMLVDQTKASKAAENASSEKTTRLSPLQRGKAVLIRATRAVKFRTNSSKSNDPGRQALLDGEDGTPPGSSSQSSLCPSNVDVNSPTQLARHFAEQENLFLEKVQTTIGDGLIKRKPLPGTHITRPLSPEIYDPLEDARVDALLASTAPDFSGFDFDFDFEVTGAPSNYSHDDVPSQRNSGSQANFDAGDCQVDSDPRSIRNGFSYMQDLAELDNFPSGPAELSTPMTGPSSTFVFSDAVSGLAQHPDVMSFASPPVDVSTPCISLEPNKRKESTSIGPGTHRNTSVKRKSAIFELQPNGSSTKRSRRDYAMSDNPIGEEAGLISDIGQTQTEGRQALLPKDNNAAIAPRDKDRVEPKGDAKRGLAMFDTEKGKGPMMSEEVESPPLPQPRAPLYKRSAIPRPTGRFYSDTVGAYGAFDTN